MAGTKATGAASRNWAELGGSDVLWLLIFPVEVHASRGLFGHDLCPDRLPAHPCFLELDPSILRTHLHSPTLPLGCCTPSSSPRQRRHAAPHGFGASAAGEPRRCRRSPAAPTATAAACCAQSRAVPTLVAGRKHVDAARGTAGRRLLRAPEPGALAAIAALDRLREPLPQPDGVGEQTRQARANTTSEHPHTPKFHQLQQGPRHRRRRGPRLQPWRER